MRKLLIFLSAFIIALSSLAQNYSGKSKFSDNWEIAPQVGIVQNLSDFSVVNPIIGVDAVKYLNTWFGAGIDFRAAMDNRHTAIDELNLSAVAKVNLTNLFLYNGTRQRFEPTPFLNVGWGHRNCSHVKDRDYMTIRVGSDFVYNVNKSRSLGLGISPSVVWGGVRDLKLSKQKGHLEIMAKLVYHFKTSNGTHSWVKHECPEPIREIVEVEKVKEVVKEIEKPIEATYIVTFAKNSAEILNPQSLNGLEGKTVKIVAFASPEGSDEYNLELSQRRANAVKYYLNTKNVKVISAVGKGAVDETSNRIALVIVQ